MLLVLKPGVYLKRTSSITPRNWNLMPPKTIDFSLSHLFEQARPSNSKGGSPAEPLILKGGGGGG